MFRRPRSTQRNHNTAADGHVRRSPEPHDPHRREPQPQVLRKHDPTGNHMPADFGDRMKHREVKRLSGITVERTRLNPNALARRFTKFIGNFTGQVRIPTNLLKPDRYPAGDQGESERRIETPGSMPED